MTKLWFKAKRYGYGWYPGTIEGWLVLCGYLFLAFFPYVLLGILGPENLAPDIFVPIFLGYMAALTVILIAICVKKGEPARWRWGGK